MSSRKKSFGPKKDSNIAFLQVGGKRFAKPVPAKSSGDIAQDIKDFVAPKGAVFTEVKRQVKIIPSGGDIEEKKEEEKEEKEEIITPSPAPYPPKRHIRSPYVAPSLVETEVLPRARDASPFAFMERKEVKREVFVQKSDPVEIPGKIPPHALPGASPFMYMAIPEPQSQPSSLGSEASLTSDVSEHEKEPAPMPESSPAPVPAPQEMKETPESPKKEPKKSSRADNIMSQSVDQGTLERDWHILRSAKKTLGIS